MIKTIYFTLLSTLATPSIVSRLKVRERGTLMRSCAILLPTEITSGGEVAGKGSLSRLLISTPTLQRVLPIIQHTVDMKPSSSIPPSLPSSTLTLQELHISLQARHGVKQAAVNSGGPVGSHLTNSNFSTLTEKTTRMLSYTSTASGRHTHLYLVVVLESCSVG